MKSVDSVQSLKYFLKLSRLLLTNTKLLFFSGYFITEDVLNDPWLIMDDKGLNTINKRSSSIWKKNQDADLMRMGKRSAFNDDMVSSKLKYNRLSYVF